MIPLKDCKNGHLYVIRARNASIGIFEKKTSSFLISRYKFDDNFLFNEDHWDTGEPHGTAKCLKLLCKVPRLKEYQKLVYLNEMAKKYRDIIIQCFADDPIYEGFTYNDKGQWVSKLR